MRDQYDRDGWIPCNERLPEEKINPITKDAYGYLVTTDFGNDVRYYTFWNGHWYHGAGIMDEHVIAWMPRPEPYNNTEDATAQKSRKETGHEIFLEKEETVF